LTNSQATPGKNPEIPGNVTISQFQWKVIKVSKGRPLDRTVLSDLQGIERRRKMHHRKQRNGSTTTTTTTPLSKSPKSDSGNETKARLRFHKKPLCLQYMVGSQCAKRHNFYKSKPKEPSLIITLVVGVLRLFSWIEYFIRNDLWYFITTPVEELERRLVFGDF
ncbi:hypothetical protein ANCCAN_00889, partial [Ancylostoma caninum]